MNGIYWRGEEMYCESCGKVINDNAKFCRHCGAQVESKVPKEENGAKYCAIPSHEELSTTNRNNYWRLTPLALGILLFITVIICIISKPDPIFLLFTYPILAVIGGLILILVRKNSIFIAVILLLLSLGYIFFAFISCPPLTLSSVLTDNRYFYNFNPATRIFFISAATGKLLLTIGAIYMILFNILTSFKIKRAVVISFVMSLILSVSIPAYSVISKVSDPLGSGDTVEAVEKIDSSHKVLLSSTFPPSESSIKSEFKQGETIYPNSQGLKGGTEYGFRITDQNGEIVEPLYRKALSSAVDKTWTNGSGCFNTPERPLPPGNYKVELIVEEGKNAFITARTDLTVKGSK
jgi:hypothetical protein